VIVPVVDSVLGMTQYATTSEGVGGFIKREAEDFVVEEMLVDGSKADVNGTVPNRVIGSTPNRQRHLLCLLVKRNWDTFIATKNVAKSLGIEPNRVQFAGIKDAKAVTAQYITLENVSIVEAAKIDVTDAKVVPIGYVREVLSLFYLLGNHFTITVRNPQAPEAQLKPQVEAVMQQITAAGGIPNFFGHQRFGTTRPITHLVGKALIRGSFEEAAMMFLAKPSIYEHPNSRAARQALQDSHDFKAAAEGFPRQLRFERLMLGHLSENPTDYVGAFRRLPPKLQALFVQAYQSYLFNQFLSERLKLRLPLNAALEGDFVVPVERSGLPLTSMAKLVTADNLDSVNGQVAAGKLRLAFPIVGQKQKLSGGIMGEVEAGILQSEGTGDDVRWLNELSRSGGKGGLRTAETPVRDFKLLEASGDSVKMSFTLLRGCYATVLLREILKPADPVSAGF
jgi:tRNA pseudouridine13 synthase